jgi:hypothetical protein
VFVWLHMVVMTCSSDFIWLWWRARLERRRWWGGKAWSADPELWARRGRVAPAGDVRIATVDGVKTARCSELVRLGFCPESTPAASHLPSSPLGLGERHYICWDWSTLDLFTCIFQVNWLKLRIWNFMFSRRRSIYRSLEWNSMSEVYKCVYKHAKVRCLVFIDREYCISFDSEFLLLVNVVLTF